MNTWEVIINHILAMPQVDDVLPVHTKGGFELADGRTCLPVNIYLRAEDENVLGIHVQDGVGIKDHFGGAHD